MSRVFAPGCALMLYKPRLAEKLGAHLSQSGGGTEPSLVCCRHFPPYPGGTEIVNVCPGCDRRYRENYPACATVSLWEVLAREDGFPLPDYGGQVMTILDACPTRERPGVHDALRALIARMNITLTEPRLTRERSVCCGDSFWGELPEVQVVRQMERRAAQMPREDVIVYCVSCVQAMAIGGRRPRYMVDLVFGEATIPRKAGLAPWHAELDAYIESHSWEGGPSA